MPDTATDEKSSSAMSVPVPLPRQNLPSSDPEELGDKLINETPVEPNKSGSKASSKNSSSDSGIEDGKSSPTSEEEKVLFEVLHSETEKKNPVSDDACSLTVEFKMSYLFIH